jgi:hypothetical protein
MFLASSADPRHIASNLLPLAQKIEERSPRLRVLAARQFRYPVQQQEISVRIDRYRQVNLLEKFILRASAEISPPPSLEEVADALGLDPIFIKSVFDELNDSKSIISTDEGLHVTEEGKQILSSETISEEPEYESWYYLQDALLGTTTFVRHPLDEMDEELEQLEDLNSYVKQDLAQFPLFALNPVEHQAQFQELGLDSHDPDQGWFVTELAPAAPPELCWNQIAIFVLHDLLSEDKEKNITIQAYQEDQLVPQVGEWLEIRLQEQNFSLKELCGYTEDIASQKEESTQGNDSPEDQSVKERLEEIDHQAKSQLRSRVEGQTLEKESETAVQLRDVEIHRAFRQALKEASEQIIIYSPWMNEQVVDNEFLSLLEERVRRGVRILIGYGIGQDEKKEEHSIPPSLIQRLHAIQTTEGTPGIIAEWLGNSHAKEIVIDQKIHFSGSQNWLSYRGDWLPRGETVYKVTIAAEVEKAYNYLAQRFIKRAQALWARATDEERRRALCILGYLGCEQDAAAWIQRDACYHLIPLWLTLAQQAVSAGHETRLLAPLRTLIAFYGSTTELPGSLRTEIATALQDVLKKMTQENQELIANLVNGVLLKQNDQG